MAPTVDPPSAWMSASEKSLARRLHFEQGKTRTDIGGGVCWGGTGTRFAAQARDARQPMVAWSQAPLYITARRRVVLPQ